jgi:hypothetical protein
MPARPWTEPDLAFRLNMQREWIWELIGRDLHVVNRSDAGFSTRSACMADARLHGFAISAKPAPRRSLA